MGRPQQPELYRSGSTPLEPDSVEGQLAAYPRPADEPSAGKVPEQNRPGHLPRHEEDQPDPDAVARRLGTVSPTEIDRGGPGWRRVALVGVGAAVLMGKAVVAGVRRAARALRPPSE
jgi:hypothetical protein